MPGPSVTASPHPPHFGTALCCTGSEFMPARHAGRDVLSECIRGIDVKRGAAGELNRVFGLKFMELLEKRLSDIGNGHLTFNSDFHSNILK
jgi:hypothetical protein